MKHSRVVLLILTAFFLLDAQGSISSAHSTSAKKQATGRIRGVLVDPNDAVVIQAEITIEGVGIKRTLQPDEFGEFTIELHAGVYKIVVWSKGFSKFESNPFKLKAGGVQEIKINLEICCSGKHFCYLFYDTLIERQNAPLGKKMGPRKIVLKQRKPGTRSLGH